MNALAAADACGWRAQLALGFARGPHRTELRRREHRGPLRVQRPFHPEPGGTCHVYVLHPPGGIVGGDTLALDIEAAAAAHALVTTPGAAKFYRSAGATATVEQRLAIGADAVLEWLPQETLYFDGARARVRTTVTLARAASFIGWDITCLGRPAAGAAFRSGAIDARVEIHDVHAGASRPRLLERLCFAPAGAAAAPGWHGCAATGTLYAAGPALDAAGGRVPDDVQELVGAFAGPAGVTIVDDVLACRALAPDALTLRSLFQAVWTLLRPQLLGRPAVIPRIWHT